MIKSLKKKKRLREVTMYWKLYSEIKTGRFTVPKTPEDLGICDH